MIEELGGYENAKERGKRENVLNDDDFNYMQRKLLEYRRENNIFEVGDYILTNDPASEGRVYEIVKKHNEHYKIKSGIGFRHCSEWRIERHATDLEIKAGHRL